MRPFQLPLEACADYFTEKLRLSYQKMIEEEYDKEYAKAVMIYRGLVVSRMANFLSNLCFWYNHAENPGHVFGRQILGMIWDIFEFRLHP